MAIKAAKAAKVARAAIPTKAAIGTLYLPSRGSGLSRINERHEQE